MDIEFLKDLSPVAILAVVILYLVKVFGPGINAALMKIPAAIEGFTTSNNILNATLLTMQQENKANAKAIGGLAEKQSETGHRTVIALDKIATGLDTAMRRQQQYMELQKQLNETGTQTLTGVMTLTTELTGMEEMVGEILRVALDMKDVLKGTAEHPVALLKSDDLNPLIVKLEEIEKRLLDAIKGQVIAQPEVAAETKIEEPTEPKEVQT